MDRQRWLLATSILSGLQMTVMLPSIARVSGLRQGEGEEDIGLGNHGRVAVSARRCCTPASCKKTLQAVTGADANERIAI